MILRVPLAVVLVAAVAVGCGRSVMEERGDVAPAGDADTGAYADGDAGAEDAAPGDNGDASDAETDARDAVADDGAGDDDATDAAAATPGVACGASRCEAGTSFCMACPHYEPGGEGSPPDAHCEPSAAEGWTFGGALDEHPCDFPGVFIECDGPEDCAEDEVCTFSGGEFGYGQCWPAGEAFGAVACHTDADCTDGSRCGEVDPLGYFSPSYDLLGWRPRACGGASAEATAFCDRVEEVCGLGEHVGFYARAGCLAHLDGLTVGQHECAFSHLEEAEAGDTMHCAHASDPAPCAP